MCGGVEFVGGGVCGYGVGYARVGVCCGLKLVMGRYFRLFYRLVKPLELLGA